MDTSILLISALVGLVIPLVTQVLARAHASDPTKAVVALALASADGVLTPLVGASGHVDWKLIAYSILSAFLTSLAAHQGIWKPLSVTGHEGVLGQNVGVHAACPKCNPVVATPGDPEAPAAGAPPPDPAP